MDALGAWPAPAHPHPPMKQPEPFRKFNLNSSVHISVLLQHPLVPSAPYPQPNTQHQLMPTADLPAPLSATHHHLQCLKHSITHPAYHPQHTLRHGAHVTNVPCPSASPTV